MFNTVVFAMPSLIAYIDTDFNYRFVNQNYEDWCGVKRERCLTSKVWEVIGESAFKSIESQLKAAFLGVEQNFEKKIHYRTNEIRHVRINYIPDCDAKGKITGIISIVQNRDEIENQKEENLQRQTFLEAVLQNVPSMIFVKDRTKNLSFSYLNQAGEKLLGIDAEKLIGKTDFDFFPKEQAEGFLKADQEIMREKAVLKIDQEIIDTPLGKRILCTYKVPLHDKNNKPSLLIGISNDITEEVHAKENLEMERLKTIQTAKLISLGEMSAGIAHEINNPLAIISGALMVLDKFKNDPEKAREKINLIKRANERISKIVKSLKKFSRFQEKPIYQSRVLAEIVRECCNLTEPRASLFSTAITVDIKSESSILCDEVEIEQVIINLLNNGIDAIKDLPEKWIKIGLFENQAKLILQIRDSGAGIPLAGQEKLFQPFFTTKAVGEGTGLGLSIVNGILKNHNAEITINNEDVHTCFEIQFPIELKLKSAA